MSDLELSYQERYTKALQPLAQALEGQLQEYLEGEPRIDRVNASGKVCCPVYDEGQQN
jgi:hypothetical protein